MDINAVSEASEPSAKITVLTTETLAWHRWFLFGPVLLGCLLVIFMAGQDSTMFYSIRGKEPPTHRQATFVEHRQAENFNHVKKITTWLDYVDVDYERLPTTFAGRNSATSTPPRIYSPIETANCTAAFLDSLWPALATVTHTDPAAAMAALERLRLRNFRPAIRVLGSMLLEPVPVTDFLARVTSCTASNAQFVEWGCQLAGVTGLSYRQGGAYINNNSTSDFVTHMVVLETLTKAAVDGAHFAKTMVLAARTEFEAAGGRDHIIANWDGTQEALSFLLDKIGSIEDAAHRAQESRTRPDNARPMSAAARQYESRQIEQNLQINILEATALDMRVGLDANAYVGLSLATDVTARGSLYQGLADPVDASVRVHWSLGKDWVDTYNSWNAAFVLTHFKPEKGSIAKLFIPSIVCNDQHEQADQWVAARTYSLYLVAHEVRHVPVFSSPPGPPNPEYLRRFGESNLASLGVPAASSDEVHWLITSMPSTLSLAVWVDAKSWRIITCFTLWGSTMLLAWGIEIIAAAKLSEAKASTHEPLLFAQRHWMLAELCFPLFLSIAFYSRSVFGLPFLVAALWKLGCPETSAYFVAAHLRNGPDGPISTLQALGDFLTGIGTVFHHSCATLFVTSLVAGAFSAEADPDSIMAVTVPLVYQHWAVKLKHVNFVVYVGMLLVLEIWWEFEVFAALPHFRFWHEQRGMWGMLVSHWCYWLGEGLLVLSTQILRVETAAKSRRRSTGKFFTSSACPSTMVRMAEILQLGRESLSGSSSGCRSSSVVHGSSKAARTPLAVHGSSPSASL
eukprot:m.315771 g.315771  ORF g.315771 m.315771 type:complete len:796 (+) comp27530_c0_seq2:121-2508(+)